ncbi:hypothetical protein ACFX2F_039241 [Malus domestica]
MSALAGSGFEVMIAQTDTITPDNKIPVHRCRDLPHQRALSTLRRISRSSKCMSRFSSLSNLFKVHRCRKTQPKMHVAVGPTAVVAVVTPEMIVVSNYGEYRVVLWREE